MASRVFEECELCLQTHNKAKRSLHLPCKHKLCSACIKKFHYGVDSKCPICYQRFDQLNSYFCSNDNGKKSSQKTKHTSKNIALVCASSSETLEDLKVKIAENTEYKIGCCQDAQDLIKFTIRNNTKLKNNLVQANNKILSDILARLQNTVIMNMKYVEKLDAENRMLEDVFKAMKEKQEDIHKIQIKLAAVVSLKTAASLFEEVKDINEKFESCLKRYKDFFDKNQDTTQGATKTLKVTEQLSCLVEEHQGKTPELSSSAITPHCNVLADISVPIGTDHLEDMCKIHHLMTQGRMCAQKYSEGKRRYSRISVNDKYVCLHHLTETPPPANSHLLEYDDVMRLIDPSSTLTFIQLTSVTKRRFLGMVKLSSNPVQETLGFLCIRRTSESKEAESFVLCCTGEKSCLRGNTRVLSVCNEDYDSEHVCFGNSESRDPRVIVEKTEVFQVPWLARTVTAEQWNESNEMSQFAIYTRDNPEKTLNHSIGFVEDGFSVLTEAISRYPDYINDIFISDCGIVLLTL